MVVVVGKDRNLALLGVVLYEVGRGYGVLRDLVGGNVVRSKFIRVFVMIFSCFRVIPM